MWKDELQEQRKLLVWTQSALSGRLWMELPLSMIRRKPLHCEIPVEAITMNVKDLAL